jgi:hypothetical protein
VKNCGDDGREGYQNGKQLLAEIRKLGYAGSYDSLTRFLAPWRAEKRAAEKAETEASQQIDKTTSAEFSHRQVSVAMRHISPQMAAALLSKPRVQLSSRQSEILDFLKRSCPNFRDPASPGVEFPRNPVWREGLQFKALGGESRSYRDWRHSGVCTAIEEGLASGRTCGGTPLEQRSNRRAYQPIEDS